jgi:hypothetical protein
LVSTGRSVVLKIRICPLTTQSELVIMRNGFDGHG